MDIVEFKEFIESNKIAQKAKKEFRESFDQYKEEEKVEFNEIFSNYDEKKLYTEISSVSFKLGNWPECDYNHIVVLIPIHYDGTHLGNYTSMFRLDGSFDDDSLHLF